MPFIHPDTTYFCRDLRIIPVSPEFRLIIRGFRLHDVRVPPLYVWAGHLPTLGLLGDELRQLGRGSDACLTSDRADISLRKTIASILILKPVNGLLLDIFGIVIIGYIHICNE